MRYAHIKSWSGITIVTDSDLVESRVSDRLNAWLTIICNMAIEKHVQIPETSHLFLEVHQDSDTCNYYFADHGLRTVFWLHMLDTISARLPPFNSGGYLRMPLIHLFTFQIESKFCVQNTP